MAESDSAYLLVSRVGGETKRVCVHQEEVSGHDRWASAGVGLPWPGIPVVELDRVRVLWLAGRGFSRLLWAPRLFIFAGVEPVGKESR